MSHSILPYLFSLLRYSDYCEIPNGNFEAILREAKHCWGETQREKTNTKFVWITDLTSGDSVNDFENFEFNLRILPYHFPLLRYSDYCEIANRTFEAISREAKLCWGKTEREKTSTKFHWISELTFGGSQNEP